MGKEEEFWKSCCGRGGGEWQVACIFSPCVLAVDPLLFSLFLSPFFLSPTLFLSQEPRAPWGTLLLYPASFVRQQLSGQRNSFLDRQPDYSRSLHSPLLYPSPLLPAIERKSESDITDLARSIRRLQKFTRMPINVHVRNAFIRYILREQKISERWIHHREILHLSVDNKFYYKMYLKWSYNLFS